MTLSNTEIGYVTGEGDRTIAIRLYYDLNIDEPILVYPIVDGLEEVGAWLSIEQTQELIDLLHVAIAKVRDAGVK